LFPYKLLFHEGILLPRTRISSEEILSFQEKKQHTEGYHA